ncbi:MAG: hypothetical protein KAG98_01365 [Lentisphaeria bacterium]|nr:hypothetical protein [Lentisphaeria bacterium]
MKISMSWLTYNFPKKVFALFLAVVIWFAVSSDIQNTISFSEIPVELKVSNSDYMLIYKDQPKVSITIKGTAEGIRELRSQDIRIPFIVAAAQHGTDLTNSQILQVNQPIDLSTISLPNGLRVVRVAPSRLTVVLDRKITKRIPVVVVTSGNLPENVKELEERREVIPSEIKVTGPASIVNKMANIRTKPIHFDSSPINSFSNQYSQIVELTKQVSSIKVSPKEVSVLLKLSETKKEKSYFDIPVALIDYSRGRKLVTKQKIPNLNQVVLYGANQLLEKFDKANIKAFVDISAVKKESLEKVDVHVWVDDLELKVRFISPMSLELELIEPQVWKNDSVPKEEDSSKGIKRDLLESLEK